MEFPPNLYPSEVKTYEIGQISILYIPDEIRLYFDLDSNRLCHPDRDKLLSFYNYLVAYYLKTRRFGLTFFYSFLPVAYILMISAFGERYGHSMPEFVGFLFFAVVMVCLSGIVTFPDKILLPLKRNSLKRDIQKNYQFDWLLDRRNV